MKNRDNIFIKSIKIFSLKLILQINLKNKNAI